MLYEAGIRSPLIVWGPRYLAKGKSGTTNHSSVFAAIDLVPTILEFAGVPSSENGALDGEPLRDVLLGESGRSRTTPLYFRRPPDRPQLPGERNLPDLAVRDGYWKLLCEYDGSEPQLYNLDTDPGEKSNLASDHATDVIRLTTPLLKWNASMPADSGATYTALVKANGKKRIPVSPRK